MNNLQQCKHEHTIGDNCVNCSVNNVSNLQQFLEEIQKRFDISLQLVNPIAYESLKRLVIEHDNKVLDEVKKEVEKKKGILWNDDEQKHRKNIIRYDLILEILELIDQLKLKNMEKLPIIMEFPNELSPKNNEMYKQQLAVAYLKGKGIKAEIKDGVVTIQ